MSESKAVPSDTSGVGQEVIFLNWSENDKGVVVTPQNEDRYYVTVDEAIRACDKSQDSSRFSKQFDTLTKTIAHWLKDHSETIGNAYLTVRDRGLLLLIKQKGVAFNETFEDALTDLDIEIANDRDLDLIELSVFALPNVSGEALQSFLNPHMFEFVRGKGN